MKTTLRRSLASILIGLTTGALATPSRAQSIGVYSSPTGEDNCIAVLPSQELFELYVVVTPAAEGNTGTLSSVHFEIPTSYLPFGMIYIEYVPVFAGTTFSRFDHNDVTVNFGSCEPWPIQVLTIRALCFAPPPDCSDIWISAIEARDCNNQVVTLSGGPTFARSTLDSLCGLAPPTHPYPADGATNVARDVVLTWDGMMGQHSCDGPDYFSPCFGTTPDPPIVTTEWRRSYDPPGLLQTNTTYYWKVFGVRPGIGDVSTPVWSFSTGPGPVSTHPTTWGRIKALYR